MNSINLAELGKKFREDFREPTLLFEDTGNRILWLGVPEASAFRSNSYLIVDHDEAVLVDPGGNVAFEFVRNRVTQVIPGSHVIAQILSHPDPDAAASFASWIEVNPQMKVLTSFHTNTLLCHFRDVPYEHMDVREHPEFRFTSGKILRFIPSPFLHAPGAFATWDASSGYLFSGDVWAALDMEWTLLVDDFAKHELKLNLFQIESMASGKAARGFVERIRQLELNAILPQHGRIIPREFVPRALDYLSRLKCGLDILYTD